MGIYREFEIIGIKQEIDLLRRELRVGRFDGPVRNFDGPIRNSEEAVEVIRQYLMRGAPDEYIIERVVRRGVPRPWAVESVREERMKLGIRRRPTKPIKTPEPPPVTSTNPRQSQNAAAENSGPAQ